MPVLGCGFTKRIGFPLRPVEVLQNGRLIRLQNCGSFGEQVTLVIRACLVCLPIFAVPKPRYANKIWLSIGLCLEINHFDQNHGKLLETS
jgi:hypothetical protein